MSGATEDVCRGLAAGWPHELRAEGRDRTDEGHTPAQIGAPRIESGLQVVTRPVPRRRKQPSRGERHGRAPAMAS